MIIIFSWPSDNQALEPSIDPDSDSLAIYYLPDDEELSPDSKNPNGDENYINPQPENSYDQQTLDLFNYSGKWWLWENEIRSGYLLISQNGNYFQFDYYYFDQKVGSGTGKYDGTYLFSTEFDLYSDNEKCSWYFESYDQGTSWDGQTYVNGTPITVARLIKD